jgi:hypothetical protein
MGAQQQHAEGLAGPGALGQHVLHGAEIAEGLRHLLAIHEQHAVMQPGAGHRRGAEGAAALRHLVLVMGKEQVVPAAMDVESLAQMLPGHGEHSMCQPGRPRPQGLSQPGVASSEGFHKTKSPASRL